MKDKVGREAHLCEVQNFIFFTRLTEIVDSAVIAQKGICLTEGDFQSHDLLNELDKELEKRGHHYVRYADDFSIYVKSKQKNE